MTKFISNTLKIEQDVAFIDPEPIDNKLKNVESFYIPNEDSEVIIDDNVKLHDDNKPSYLEQKFSPLLLALAKKSETKVNEIKYDSSRQKYKSDYRYENIVFREANSVNQSGDNESSDDNSSPMKMFYKCGFPTCHQQFAQRRSLLKHENIHRIKRFICHMCGKGFHENSKLKRHFLVHSGQKDFECPYPDCMKKFALFHNMKIHLRVHTGEKPFKCHFPSCTRAFSQSANLKSHLTTHLRKLPCRNNIL